MEGWPHFQFTAQLVWGRSWDFAAPTTKNYPPPKMSIVPKLRILGLQVFSISVILLHRASKCFTRNLHAMKAKLFSTVFTSLGLNSPGIKSPSFQMAVHYDAGLLHEQSCSISFNSACVVLEFCYLITATNNGTCTYSGCLGSKDTHYCLNLSFSRLQAHKTWILCWKSNLASPTISMAIFPLSLPNCSYW